MITSNNNSDKISNGVKKILIGWVMLGLIMGLSNGSGAEDKKPGVPDLIRQLGVDDWQVREDAQKELTRLGEQLIEEYRKASGALRQASGVQKENAQRITQDTQRSIEKFAKPLQDATQSKDPEIRMRTKQIRRHFYTLTSPKIAFVSRRDGNYEIYVIDSDGQNQTRLTDNKAEDLYPTWSPDGTKIAFQSKRDGNREIYVMDADGQNQTRLTKNKTDNTFPAWSLDGKKIAFVSARDGNAAIYVMDADGTNQTRLTENKELDALPAWSPDGTKIAFASDRDGNNSAIYVMDADGHNQTRLTENKADDLSPAWSPISFPELTSLFALNQ